MKINVRVNNPVEAAAVFGVLAALDTEGDEWGSDGLMDEINTAIDTATKYPYSMQLDLASDYAFVKNTRPGVPVAKFLEQVGQYGFAYTEAGAIEGHTVRVFTDGRVHVGCKKLTADDVEKIVAWFRKTAPKINEENPEDSATINGKGISIEQDTSEPFMSIDGDGYITAKEIDRVMKVRAKVMAKAKAKK